MLHATDFAENEYQDIYSGHLGGRTLPKFVIPREPSDPRTVYALIRDELALDGNSAQNLATFCTTWTEPEIHRLMDDCLGKNMIDKDEYPQTAEIESRCVHILANLWNSPSGARTIGCSTTGSSEAAMLAGLALKWRWRGSGRPNLVCGPVQVCWEKFARYFDVELRQVPLEPGATGLRPNQLRDHVDENTIGVVAILGITSTCDYEPVAALAAVCYTTTEDAGFALYDLSTQLRIKGWQVPSYPLPPDRQESVVQRVLVRHGISRDVVSLLARDIRRGIKELAGVSPKRPQVGFHH